MKREASPPRPDFAVEAASIGFEFAFDDGEPYWDERVRYVFTRREVENHLEKAAATRLTTPTSSTRCMNG